MSALSGMELHSAGTHTTHVRVTTTRRATHECASACSQRASASTFESHRTSRSRTVKVPLNSASSSRAITRGFETMELKKRSTTTREVRSLMAEGTSSSSVSLTKTDLLICNSNVLSSSSETHHKARNRSSNLALRARPRSSCCSSSLISATERLLRVLAKRKRK